MATSFENEGENPLERDHLLKRTLPYFQLSIFHGDMLVFRRVLLKANDDQIGTMFSYLNLLIRKIILDLLFPMLGGGYTQMAIIYLYIILNTHYE